MFKKFLLVLAAFIVAIIIAVVLTSVMATQLNLASIQSMGLEVTFAKRVENTFFDLKGIFPMLTIVLSVCFALGFIVAGFLVIYTPISRYILFTLAGGCSFLTFIYIIHTGMGAIPIEGAATWGGRLLLALCPAIAGLAFAWLTKPRKALISFTQLGGAS